MSIQSILCFSCSRLALPASQGFTGYRRSAWVAATLLLAWCGQVASAQTPASLNGKDAAAQVQPAVPESIDFGKARELLLRQQRGESLTVQQRAYLERARALRTQAAKGATDGSLIPRETVGFKPLTEMSAEDRYQGEDGGLYGKGLNQPPPDHRRLAEAALARIQPLDNHGTIAVDGRVVMVSLSMSNATQEFSRFKQLADAYDRKSTTLTIVDCAQGGQAMAEWAPPQAAVWREADRRLAEARVTPEQVQVAWVKLANKSPRGSLQEHGRALQRDTLAVIHNAQQRFPNLRVVYLSSRIYGGYAKSALNPEPYAYESAWVVRWLIQSQMAQAPELNCDAARGPVKAPVLLWGPYLWADGTTPRVSDQLTYVAGDFANDGTHPSNSGRDKVARTMLAFFTSDPLAKSWFVKETHSIPKTD